MWLDWYPVFVQHHSVPVYLLVLRRASEVRTMNSLHEILKLDTHWFCFDELIRKRVGFDSTPTTILQNTSRNYQLLWYRWVMWRPRKLYGNKVNKVWAQRKCLTSRVLPDGYTCCDNRHIFHVRPSELLYYSPLLVGKRIMRKDWDIHNGQPRRNGWETADRNNFCGASGKRSLLLLKHRYVRRGQRSVRITGCRRYMNTVLLGWGGLKHLVPSLVDKTCWRWLGGYVLRLWSRQRNRYDKYSSRYRRGRRSTTSAQSKHLPRGSCGNWRWGTQSACHDVSGRGWGEVWCDWLGVGRRLGGIRRNSAEWRVYCTCRGLMGTSRMDEVGLRVARENWNNFVWILLLFFGHTWAKYPTKDPFGTE